MHHKTRSYHPVEPVIIVQVTEGSLLEVYKTFRDHWACDQVEPNSNEVVNDHAKVAVELRVWTLVFAKYPNDS